MRNADRDLLTYLENCKAITAKGLSHAEGRRFGCYQHVALELGRAWEAASLPIMVTMGQVQQCYHNTLALVRAAPDTFRYVEGFAVSPHLGLPVHHAWAVDRHDRVYDRTWIDSEESAYYGIVFPWHEVEQFVAISPDCLGILETEYVIGQPLLKTGVLTFPDPAAELAAPDPGRLGIDGDADAPPPLGDLSQTMLFLALDFQALADSLGCAASEAAANDATEALRLLARYGPMMHRLSPLYSRLMRGLLVHTGQSDPLRDPDPEHPT